MTNTLRNMPRYIRNTDAFGWQGADNPDGPWRSIPPPQSGTPWQQGNTPMDDPRQTSAEVSGVEVLSPPTLHVWDAFCNIVEDHGPPRRGLAAALRAAADQVVPEREVPRGRVVDLGGCAVEVFPQNARGPIQRLRLLQEVRGQLLAIAAELEGTQAEPPRYHIFPTPHQIAECGGPCEQGGPEACDCGLYERSASKSTH